MRARKGRSKLRASMSDQASDAARLFRNRNYLLFWTSRSLMTLAVMSESVTIGWQVYEVARRSLSVNEAAFMVGMVGLVQFAPLFALTLIAGEVADRRDRRAVFLVCVGIEIVCVYLPFAKWILVTTLVVLSAVKFLFVIFYFMHLRWDKPFCTILFFIGLVLAAGTMGGLLMLFGAESSVPLPT